MSEPSDFRSGFICVVGRPNVGKSTLLNRLLGQKIAAVSPRPQTTQRNQLGILTDERCQMIFIDTPGIHKPLSRLGNVMNENAVLNIADSDCVLWLTDASEAPTPEDEMAARKIREANAAGKTFIVLNKCDITSEKKLAANAAAYAALLEGSRAFRISSVTGAGIDELLDAVRDRLPAGPAFYDPEQITDLYEREIAADLIRESLLKNLDDEIPHAIAVRIDEYTDRSESSAYIQATLLLDRDSHKGIVIGKNGEMLRKIGQYARREIEKLTDRKIYLELHVKVMKNWRNNNELLRQLGIDRLE